MNPLVIVLEGPNGSGKTTLARMLASDRDIASEPGRVVRYRAFEHALTGSSMSTPLCDSLKSAGVPLNTHVDDLYAADSIARLLSPNDMVVLDRSFPSGIAYARAGIERVGTVTGSARAILAADQCARDAPEPIWRIWLQTWCDLIPRRLYVTMLVSHEAGRARTAERSRWHPSVEQHKKLEAQFLLIHSLVSGNRLLIDSEAQPVSATLELIKSRLRELCPA